MCVWTLTYGSNYGMDGVDTNTKYCTCTGEIGIFDVFYVRISWVCYLVCRHTLSKGKHYFTRTRKPVHGKWMCNKLKFKSRLLNGSILQINGNSYRHYDHFIPHHHSVFFPSAFSPCPMLTRAIIENIYMHIYTYRRYNIWTMAAFTCEY